MSIFQLGNKRLHLVVQSIIIPCNAFQIRCTDVTNYALAFAPLSSTVSTLPVSSSPNHGERGLNTVVPLNFEVAGFTLQQVDRKDERLLSRA